MYFSLANAETLENHCRALEVGFAKSYVHGLFESLQAGNYIHKYDVQEAVRLCKETKIEVKLSEFIQVRLSRGNHRKLVFKLIFFCLDNMQTF